MRLAYLAVFFLCVMEAGATAPGKPARTAWEAGPPPPEGVVPLTADGERSLIPWRDLKVEEWLDVGTWVRQRAWRDENPEWRSLERLVTATELVGKVIACRGECRLYRGQVSTPVRWLSRVHEGDEVHTGPESYLWMMLMDGTLVRLAPRTAVGFLETAIAGDKVFYHARLNQGLLYWLPRSAGTLKPEPLTETDQIVLPVMDLGANLEFFQREQLKGGDEAARTLHWITPGPVAADLQRQELNRLIRLNNPLATRKHEALVVAPNGSVLTRGMAFTLFFAPGGRAWLKMDSRVAAEEAGERPTPSANFLFRGYANTGEQALEEGRWMEVAADGRTISPMEEVPPMLAASEVLTKRVPTLMLVREHWLEQSAELWRNAGDRALLARRWGFRLWGEELERREEFLLEHTRRLETTNLRSLQRLVGTPDEAFDGRYFSSALESYFRAVQQRHSFVRSSVVDMAPLHYYGWVLINAGQQ